MAEGLPAELFADERAQRVAGAIAQLHASGAKVTTSGIRALLGSSDAGLAVYLAEVDIDIPDTGSPRLYLDRLRSVATRRNLLYACSRARVEAMASNVDPADAVASLRTSLDGIEATASGGAPLVTMRSLADRLLERLSRPSGELASAAGSTSWQAVPAPARARLRRMSPTTLPLAVSALPASRWKWAPTR
jgi:hypothetical protein